MNVSLYLRELVEAQDLFAVVVAMATLIHQSLELDGDLVFGGRGHGERQAAERRRWIRESNSSLVFTKKFKFKY